MAQDDERVRDAVRGLCATAADCLRRGMLNEAVSAEYTAAALLWAAEIPPSHRLLYEGKDLSPIFDKMADFGKAIRLAMPPAERMDDPPSYGEAHG